MEALPIRLVRLVSKVVLTDVLMFRVLKLIADGNQKPRNRLRGLSFLWSR